MLVLELLVLAFLFWLGVREPIKKKWWKELIIYITIFLIGSALLIMQTIGVKMPYLIDELNKFFKDVLHLSYD